MRNSAATTSWQAFLAAGICLLAPTALCAQRAAPAAVDGVATDSVHARPLSGATVFLTRMTSDTAIFRSAPTDPRGRFAFEDLPPGRYVAALEAPLLDSLELAQSPLRLSLAAGERRHVTLALPSGATLRTLACPGAQLSAGTGAVIGRVSDVEDDAPLRGVAVAVQWSETTVDRATLAATNTPHGGEVRTDSLGEFRLCGVPTDSYLDLRASLASYREALLEVVVADSAGVRRQNIALGADARAGIASDSTAPGRDMSSRPAATATLAGAVYGPAGPLAQTEVSVLEGGASVRTDAAGRYRLETLPAGTQLLDLRRVGYLPRRLSVELRPGPNSAPDVHLVRVVALDSIRVVGQRPRYREFESRARPAAFGHFLREEDIARQHPVLTSDLFRQMPGFAVVRLGTSDLDVKVLSSRGESSLGSAAPCKANIVIDGVAHQEINWIDPGSIGAMEIYPGPASAPVQYHSACGTIIIWTKRY